MLQDPDRGRSALGNTPYYFAKRKRLEHTTPPHIYEYAGQQNVWPFDRFGAFDWPEGCVLYPRCAFKPSLDYTPMATIMDARARELAEMDKPISVLWSGGIDSTGALVALLKAGVKPHIYLSEQSKLENGRFYREFIDGKHKISKVVPTQRILLDDEDTIVVTGEMNDLLHGSMQMHRVGLRLGYDVLRLPATEENFALTFRDPELSEENLPLLYRDIMASADHAHIQLKDVADLMWWPMFAWLWQTVVLRTLTWGPDEDCARVTQSHADRLHHFYEAPAFQRWAVTRHEPKILERFSSYKITVKEYIYDFDQNRDYLDHAVKRASLVHIAKTQRNWRAAPIAAPFKILTPLC